MSTLAIRFNPYNNSSRGWFDWWFDEIEIDTSTASSSGKTATLQPCYFPFDDFDYELGRA